MFCVSSFHCLRGLSVSVVLTSENSNAALSTNSFSDQTLVLGPISLPTNQSIELSLPAEADAVTSEEVRQSDLYLLSRAPATMAIR